LMVDKEELLICVMEEGLTSSDRVREEYLEGKGIVDVGSEIPSPIKYLSKHGTRVGKRDSHCQKVVYCSLSLGTKLRGFHPILGIDASTPLVLE
ncbi:hypothetical protein Ancab_002231, partial [Ancistrocladus abbreviatus]